MSALRTRERPGVPAPRRRSADGLRLLGLIVALMWLVEVINSLDGGALDRDGGLIPRDPGRLWAIFTSPFLHAGFTHLLDNTIPLVCLGALIALRGAARVALVSLVVIVLGGLGTWLIAPGGSLTVGASGLVFGYATYLLARGFFDRSVLEVLTGLVVGVLWGGALLASLVPRPGISWQGHLCGGAAGVVAAWLLAGRRREAVPGSGSARLPWAGAARR